jgi:hypothetical protein
MPGTISTFGISRHSHLIASAAFFRFDEVARRELEDATAGSKMSP